MVFFISVINVGECIVLNNMNSFKDTSSKKVKAVKQIEQIPSLVLSKSISKKVTKVRTRIVAVL